MSDRKTFQQLADIAQGLKIILLDVDGVMTDGGIILIGGLEEAKRFNVQDGMGINLAKLAGLKVGVITSRQLLVVERRATELDLDEVLQGVKDKTKALGRLLDKYGFEADQVSYIGDDIQDVSIMKMVGMPISVKNAIQEVKEHAFYVTRAEGGNGAVREAVEWLLDLRGEKKSLLSGFGI